MKSRHRDFPISYIWFTYVDGLQTFPYSFIYFFNNDANSRETHTVAVTNGAEVVSGCQISKTILIYFTGDTLKKQWKNLRDSYGKHLRSCKTSTGQAAKSIDRYKTWPWVELMAFLRPHLEFAETRTNVQRNAEEASTSQSTNTSTPINTAQSQPNDLSESQQNDQHVHSRRKRTSDQNQSQVDKVINYLSQSTKKDDDTDLLFKSYSKKLKKK